MFSKIMQACKNTKYPLKTPSKKPKKNLLDSAKGGWLAGPAPQGGGACDWAGKNWGWLQQSRSAIAYGPQNLKQLYDCGVNLMAKSRNCWAWRRLNKADNGFMHIRAPSHQTSPDLGTSPSASRNTRFCSAWGVCAFRHGHILMK